MDALYSGLLKLPLVKDSFPHLLTISVCMKVETHIEKEVCIFVLDSIYCSYMAEHNSACKLFRLEYLVCRLSGSDQ